MAAKLVYMDHWILNLAGLYCTSKYTRTLQREKISNQIFVENKIRNAIDLFVCYQLQSYIDANSMTMFYKERLVIILFLVKLHQ